MWLFQKLVVLAFAMRIKIEIIIFYEVIMF